MKEIVISCGPIPARLDSVKFITNRFKDSLALKTAEYLINQEKYDVTIVKWQHTPIPEKLTQNQNCVHIVNVEDIFDYYNWYANHAAEYDAFIMAAAVEYELYEGKKPLFFVYLPGLTNLDIVKLLEEFDLIYKDTTQETTEWALEYQVLTRMLVHEKSLLVNPSFLDISEEEVLQKILGCMPNAAKTTYQEARQLNDEEIQKLFTKEEA